MHFIKFYKKSIISIGLFLFTIFSYLNGQERYLHFTEVDGIPRNIISCLGQDRYGYLWIGTSNGISRYDGKNFYNYNELRGVSVIDLQYDSKNTVWAATSYGIYRLNRLTNYFENIIQGYITKVLEYDGEIYYLMNSWIYKFKGDKPENIYQGDSLSDFSISKEGLWISKSNEGVWLLSGETGYKKITGKFLKNRVVSIIQKIDDKLFVGCYDGRLYVIRNNKETVQVKLDNHYYFKNFVKIDKEYWLATDGNGIIVLDQDLNFSRIINRRKNTELSINSNSIYDILPGNGREIWLASYGAGLTCILPDNLLFQNILPEKGNENSLIANEAASVFVNDPLVYFGTNYGLSIWNETTRQFKNLPGENLIKELKGIKVSAINADFANTIWVGTYDGLLGKYTSDLKLIKTYHPSSLESNEMQQIVSFYKINKTNLLILTQSPNRTLLNFDIEKETAREFELYTKGSKLSYCLLNSLRENQQGELLALISNQGLYHVNLKDNVLENRLTDLNKRIDSYILDFYPDKKDRYWFASSSGLLCISRDGKYYKKYTTKEGLPSNSLIRVESVDDRFLWIGTIAGICRFDTHTAQVLNFNHSDGLPANEFLERISAKTKNGRIIFGSMAGFTIIDPSKVNLNESGIEIIISDIIFQNQSIRNREGKQLLKQPLEETKEIWLPYSKNSFSIHFFAKSKNYIKYHNYAYRLVGLEKDLNFISETNSANYTNLSPGTYTFEVKSTDKTRYGNTTRLTIHILAPWYLSTYAYIAYAILFFTITYLSMYGYLKRLELKKEKEISEFKIQKEHELSEKKLAFFTNVSHDLKTPLTLIDAPVNDLLQSENLNQEQVNKLKIISRNSKRLYKLITDLLDFRRITQKQYVLEIKETVISNIITDIYEAFKEECKNKAIDLKCEADKFLTGFVDAKKIEKILWNLLSNALKFSKKGGTISIILEEMVIDEGKNIKLIVSDNGIGISETDIQKIYDRFYKVQDSEALNQEGTGIGLSIVKELVEMHHGTIEVTSAIGKGTTFTIILPADKKYFSDDELIAVGNQDYSIFDNDNVETLDMNSQQEARKSYNQLQILLVEDNQELLEYLAGHFQKSFKVYTEKDGFNGLQLAKEINPDIILTDVQMPKMNGYEFCKEIRRNFDTSHIPVVMLTANNSIDQQIEGLSTGADAYLTKPFDIKLLDTQIYTLLERRKTLRNKFLGIETQENLEKTLPQKDIDFIFELKLFIEENILNQDLNVELLSDHFAVSMAQLHRKIKSLTGSTPNNLIKSIRLKRAYKLISEKGLRVSEAAYQTGFSDPNYFTTCFKKEFGENPSQIAITIKDSDYPVSSTLTDITPVSESPSVKTPNKFVTKDKVPIMLIAEDNDEMRGYIEGEFKSNYNIIAVSDGITAFEKAIGEIPDVIISDIVMPGLDGIELCRRLKTDERTSHIPIVLLTAKNSEENTIEGLENGADDYISKPFNISILKARINNLYNIRILLRNKFIKEPNASVKEISPSVTDERFLKKAYEIVEKYIADPEFDVQIFSSETGMSRAQLYRKIDAVSGQSVNEFIRIIRLKKAAELLKESDLPISEIVEKVGFNSFAYFTKSFKEYFGVTPSNYKH